MFPTIKVRTAATAASRRITVTTSLGCWAARRRQIGAGEIGGGASALVILSQMRRALFVAVLAVLMADASGLSSLLVPETCPIGSSESAPDSGCPAFCVRCTCACCAAAIEQTTPPDMAVASVPPRPLALPASRTLPTGSQADILHVPKVLLT